MTMMMIDVCGDVAMTGDRNDGCQVRLGSGMMVDDGWVTTGCDAIVGVGGRSGWVVCC